MWQCRARMNGRTIGQQTPEDIAQEVLIAVCGALGRFRPAETRWMAFVYGIVRNKVIDAYRAAGRDRSEPMEELPDHIDDDDRAGPEAAVLRSADRALLHELLAELPELHREVLVTAGGHGLLGGGDGADRRLDARRGARDPTPGDGEAAGADRERGRGRPPTDRSFPLHAAQPLLRGPRLDPQGRGRRG